MAGDDKDKADGFDPWADLLAETGGESGEALSFELADVSETPAAAPPTGGEAATDAFPAPDDASAGTDAAPDAALGIDDATDAVGSAEDDLVNAWLDDTSAEPGAATPLAVFAPDESGDVTADPGDDAIGNSSIEIGTGASAVDSPSGAEALGVVGGEASDAGEPTAAAEPGIDVIDFGAAAAGVAAAGAAATAATGKPMKKPKARPRKASAIGQLLGIVGGGLMAIPITLGILIWGFQKDPFKVTKHVPEEVAFLLPAQFRKGYVKPLEGGPDLSRAPSLDDLPSSDTAVPNVPLADVATDEPAAAEPAAAEPEPEVAVAPTPEPPAPPAIPEPEPLDTAALEGAVADASAALAAVKAVEDPADPVRKKLLVEWYKQLARMAQELAMLEHVAADSGRPLEHTPDDVARLHASILARPDLVDDLSRLARNWLAYSKRSGDGIVVPVTFGGARRVGPYWTSRATMIEAGGKPRELAIISRAEPSAVPGDTIIVTGLVLDGGVFWAADLRSAGDGDAAAAPVVAEPFGLPEL